MLKGGRILDVRSHAPLLLHSRCLPSLGPQISVAWCSWLTSTSTGIELGRPRRFSGRRRPPSRRPHRKQGTFERRPATSWQQVVQGTLPADGGGRDAAPPKGGPGGHCQWQGAWEAAHRARQGATWAPPDANASRRPAGRGAESLLLSDRALTSQRSRLRRRAQWHDQCHPADACQWLIRKRRRSPGDYSPGRSTQSTG